jgi:uncharacterized protein (TIGR02996 family)
MSDRTAFYKAIWAAPDDDLPRLVFADWLDEAGDHDQAHFLRLLSAARTCPPDVDRLRPLVADLRRTMVKLPPDFLRDACPVPPAVVVGPWVDVDHEANRLALEFIRQRRRERTGLPQSRKSIPVRPMQETRWESDFVVHRLWEELQPFLSPAAACAIGNVPALVDVWSGMLMAVAMDGDGYVVRVPSEMAHDLRTSATLPAVPRPGSRVRVLAAFGHGWVRGDDSVAEELWLRQAAAEFDPASRPG